MRKPRPRTKPHQSANESQAPSAPPELSLAERYPTTVMVSKIALGVLATAGLAFAGFRAGTKTVQTQPAV